MAKAIDIRKRRLKSYGHIMKIPDTRITKKILIYTQKLKTKTRWMKQVKLYMGTANNETGDIEDRKPFRQIIPNWEITLEKKLGKPAKWTEDPRIIFSEKIKKMKEHWIIRKQSYKCLA